MNAEILVYSHDSGVLRNNIKYETCDKTGRVGNIYDQGVIEPCKNNVEVRGKHG